MKNEKRDVGRIMFGKLAIGDRFVSLGVIYTKTEIVRKLIESDGTDAFGASVKNATAGERDNFFHAGVMVISSR